MFDQNNVIDILINSSMDFEEVILCFILALPMLKVILMKFFMF